MTIEAACLAALMFWSPVYGCLTEKGAAVMREDVGRPQVVAACSIQGRMWLASGYGGGSSLPQPPSSSPQSRRYGKQSAGEKGEPADIGGYQLFGGFTLVGFFGSFLGKLLAVGAIGAAAFSVGALMGVKPHGRGS